MSIQSIKTIYKKHISKRNAPKNMLKEDEQLFSHAFSKEIQATTLSTLSNVYVFFESIFSLKKPHSYNLDHPVSKITLLKNLLYFLKKGDKIDKAIYILPRWGVCYFHWLTDALPRLLVSEDRENNHTKNSIVLPQYFHGPHCKFIPESLKLLGYQVHWFDKKIFVRELILPSYTAATGNYNKEIINILRDRFLSGKQCSPYRNIFISRGNAKKRKIVNENEVIELMKLYNYEIHFFEDYTLEKQIEIMSQTKNLVGLHGAGLTNMLFMPAGGKILEFRRRNDNYNNCYFTLASALDHDYYYQQCEASSDNTKTANMTIDLQELKNNLERMKNDNSESLIKYTTTIHFTSP